MKIIFILQRWEKLLSGPGAKTQIPTLPPTGTLAGGAVPQRYPGERGTGVPRRARRYNTGIPAGAAVPSGTPGRRAGSAAVPLSIGLTGTYLAVPRQAR